MNKDTSQDIRNTPPGDDPADTVAKLMSLAGPRADIEKDRQSRVHDRVRQEWLRSTRKKKTIRWAVPLAVAATVVAAVGVGMRSPAPVLPQQVGTISPPAEGEDWRMLKHQDGILTQHSLGLCPNQTMLQIQCLQIVQ